MLDTMTVKGPASMFASRFAARAPSRCSGQEAATTLCLARMMRAASLNTTEKAYMTCYAPGASLHHACQISCWDPESNAAMVRAALQGVLEACTWNRCQRHWRAACNGVAARNARPCMASDAPGWGARGPPRAMRPGQHPFASAPTHPDRHVYASPGDHHLRRRCGRGDGQRGGQGHDAAPDPAQRAGLLCPCQGEQRGMLAALAASTHVLAPA